MDTHNKWFAEAYRSTKLLPGCLASDLPPTGKPALPESAASLDDGIHPSIDHEQYHRLDARSNSEMKQAYSPRALLCYWAGLTHLESDALRLGTAVHELVLTPGRIRFNTDWPCNPATGKGYGGDTKKVMEWMEQVKDDGGFPIAPDKLEEAERLADTLRSHQVVADLFRAGGKPEMTILWSETLVGRRVVFKAKPDLYVPGFGIVDFKTTAREVSARSWPFTVWKYRYHQQAAHYLNGAKAVGLDAPAFYHAVIQKKPPYEVMVCRLDETSIAHGAEDCRMGLNNVTDVLINKNTDWLAPQIVECGLPHSVVARYADDETELGG